MAEPWEHAIKLLVQKNPQSLVSFIMPGAVFEAEIYDALCDLSTLPDVLYRVRWKGKQIVLHVEFQRRRYTKLGTRLWKHNAQTCMQTNLPVCSVVIHLLEGAPLIPSPYVISLPDGRSTQRLDFETIKLWETAPEVLEQPELVGLLPLLPLTKGDNRREIVERMIKGLEKAGKQDLLVLGYEFSLLVLTADDDTLWLKTRFSIDRLYPANTEARAVLQANEMKP
jgi:hypothetical protein